MIDLRTPTWMRQALCATTDDPDLWFADTGLNDINAAKRICRACPVQTDCLNHALTTEEPHGVWGAATTPERLNRKKKART